MTRRLSAPLLFFALLFSACQTAPVEYPEGQLAAALVLEGPNRDVAPRGLRITATSFRGESLWLAGRASLDIRQTRESADPGADGRRMVEVQLTEASTARLSSWASEWNEPMVAILFENRALAVGTDSSFQDGTLHVTGLHPSDASLLLDQLRESTDLPRTPVDLRPVLLPGQEPLLDGLTALDYDGSTLRFGTAHSFGLQTATAYQHPQTGKWVILLEIRSEEAGAFSELTRHLIGRRVGLFAENQLLGGTPTVNSELPGACFLESAGLESWTEDEAWAIVDLLWYGSDDPGD